MNRQRTAQIATLKEFAARGDTVAELTVPAVDFTVEHQDFALTGLDGKMRLWTVISVVRWHWEGVGPVITLGLYRPEGDGICTP